MKTQEVVYFEPNRTLRKKIGENINLATIFTPEKVEACQKIVDDSRGQFVEWVAKDLMMLEHACRRMESDKANSPATIERIKRLAFSIKSQSGTFGYDLASMVAKSLYDFSLRYQPEDLHLATVRQHVDALRSIFLHHIMGMGDALGEELLRGLEKLVQKSAQTI